MVGLLSKVRNIYLVGIGGIGMSGDAKKMLETPDIQQAYLGG